MSHALVTALSFVAVTCVVANVTIAIADFAKARFVLANSAEVGLRPSVIPYLAALKIAGAAGLIAGFLGIRWLGLAAGIGLVLFFVGAIGAHVRARVFYNIAFPSAFLVLALGAAAYFAHWTVAG